MSDLFNIYEDKLNTTLDRIKKIIETFSNLSREKAESAIQDAYSCIKESDKILKQMEIECSASVSNKLVNSLIMKFKNYTNEFESIKKTFLKIQDNYIKNKSEELIILGADDNKIGDIGGHHKKNLITNDEMAWEQGEKLEKVKRDALEMEVISVDVMRQLDHQTNQMKHIGMKVNDINGNLEESNLLLNGMKRRINKNKKILIIFFVILILAFVCYMLYRIYSKESKN